jgi:hypothetical protein
LCSKDDSEAKVEEEDEFEAFEVADSLLLEDVAEDLFFFSMSLLRNVMRRMSISKEEGEKE